MWNKIATAFVNLLKVKTLVTLAMISTTCYLAVRGVLDIAAFMGLVGCIITYYFTKKDSDDKDDSRASGD